MRTLYPAMLCGMFFIHQACAVEPYQPQSYTSPFASKTAAATKLCSSHTTTDPQQNKPAFELVGIFSFSHHRWAFIRTREGQLQQLQQGEHILNTPHKVLSIDDSSLIYSVEDICHPSQDQRIALKR
tara:strand:+ start:376 stop:756 length:381 start_codon:yes stop_codon:yes gene_type:complete